MRQMFSVTTVYLIHRKIVFLLVVVFCLPFFFLKHSLTPFFPRTHVFVRLVTPNQCLRLQGAEAIFLLCFVHSTLKNTCNKIYADATNNVTNTTRKIIKVFSVVPIEIWMNK